MEFGLETVLVCIVSRMQLSALEVRSEKSGSSSLQVRSSMVEGGMRGINKSSVPFSPGLRSH